MLTNDITHQSNSQYLLVFVNICSFTRYQNVFINTCTNFTNKLNCQLFTITFPNFRPANFALIATFPIMPCTHFCSLFSSYKWRCLAFYSVKRTKTSSSPNLLCTGQILCTQQVCIQRCSSQTLRGVLVGKTTWWCGISFDGSWKHAVVNSLGSVARGEIRTNTRTHTHLNTLSVLPVLEVCSNTQ